MRLTDMTPQLTHAPSPKLHPNRKAALGVELSHGSIYTSHVKWTAAGFHWESCYELAEQMTLADFQQTLPDTLSNFQFDYRWMKTVEQIGMDEISLSMPLEESRLLSFALPSAQEHDLREMIRTELSSRSDYQHLDQFVFWESHVNNIGADSGLTNYWVYRTSTAEIHPLLNNLEKQRLTCQEIHLMPFALANALAASPHQPAPGCGQAVIHWGQSQAMLILFVNQMPVYMRVLKNSRYGLFLKAVSEHFQVSIATSRDLLRTYGLIGSTQKQPPVASSSQHARDDFGLARDIALIVENLMQDFVSQIEKTRRYIQAEFTQPLDPTLIMTGEGGTLAGLSAWAQINIKSPLTPWSFSDPEQSIPRSLHPLYAVSTGLSIGSLS